MGVTVRELNGYAPASATYDADGNLISTTVYEPRFGPGDKALLLAARRRARAPRGPHGHLMSEATDPKNVGKFRPSAFVVDFAEQARVDALDQIEAEYGKDMARYMTFGIELDD